MQMLRPAERLPRAGARCELDRTKAAAGIYLEGTQMLLFARETLETGFPLIEADREAISCGLAAGLSSAAMPAGAIRRAQTLLNDRPRKVLNYRIPHEAFTTLVAPDS